MGRDLFLESNPADDGPGSILVLVDEDPDNVPRAFGRRPCAHGHVSLNNRSASKSPCLTLVRKIKTASVEKVSECVNLPVLFVTKIKEMFYV